LKRFNTTEYKSALLKKGFRSERDTGDEIIYLYLDGKKTHVFTKVSHGSAEDIRNVLLDKMKKQLYVTNKQFEELIGCTMDGPGYLKILRDRNVLSKPE